jgi:predicted nucleotidyltransferase
VNDTTIRDVLGQHVPVASLANVVRGKIWAWSDEGRRVSKRKKDELDLVRILEAYPELRHTMPQEIKDQLPEV